MLQTSAEILSHEHYPDLCSCVLPCGGSAEDTMLVNLLLKPYIVCHVHSAWFAAICDYFGEWMRPEDQIVHIQMRSSLMRMAKQLLH